MVLAAKDRTGILADLEQFLRKELLKEWTAQGHHMSGKIVHEADFVVETVLNALRVDLYIYPYGGYIESGVDASDIPYSGPSGRGGKSKYIEALIGYVQKRMQIADDAQAKSVAFAIAETQREKGMPTPDSYRFSTTGKRTDWISEAYENNDVMIREFMYRYINVVFQTQFTNMIRKYQQKFRE